MIPRLLAVLTPVLALSASIGCKKDEFKEDQELGGVVVSKDVLNEGLGLFRKYCASCHGKEGKGQTSPMRGQKKARNFTLGKFKYTSVRGDGLPLDKDLERTIKNGIRGTQMAPFSNLSDGEVTALVHYIKTFSARWRREKAGEEIPILPDPWNGKRKEAIDRGLVVYHTSAQCWTCHPAYVPREAILEWSRDLDLVEGRKPRKSMPFRGKLERSPLIETAYGMVLPPDFLSDTLPAARGLEGLYRAVSAGIGGTPMPTWHERLAARDLWAVVHFVRELVRLRGTPAAAAYRVRMRHTITPGKTP